jgi:hypothetical protein
VSSITVNAAGETLPLTSGAKSSRHFGQVQEAQQPERKQQERNDRGEHLERGGARVGEEVVGAHRADHLGQPAGDGPDAA